MWFGRERIQFSFHISFGSHVTWALSLGSPRGFLLQGWGIPQQGLGIVMDSLRADERHDRDSESATMLMRGERGPYPNSDRIDHKLMKHRWQQPQNTQEWDQRYKDIDHTLVKYLFLNVTKCSKPLTHLLNYHLRKTQINLKRLQNIAPNKF